MTGPDSLERASIEQGGLRRERRSGAGFVAALCLAGALTSCQSSQESRVYLDPAANLGTPPIAASAARSGLPTDAQGQPNDEFDGQSWIDRRRGPDEPPRAPGARPGPKRTTAEDIPLLHAPAADGPELSPGMFRRGGRS